MPNPTNPPERYTSYHPNKTYSLLEKARRRIKDQSCGCVFEYNGMRYSFFKQASTPNNDWRLVGNQMSKYVETDGITEPGQEHILTITEFNGDDFESFVETFEIEGKTVKWILEHQRTWKYKLTAEYFERVLTGYSFCFVYRGTPCHIYTSKEYANPRPTDGRYLRILAGIQYDVARYAPLSPNAEHWITDMPGYYDTELTPNNIIIGPFQTVGGLLDTIQFGGKTLREIFDDEYNDGDVLCGIFDG